ncbi:MAG: alpha/beta hydrolase [Clostridia bacterium]
MAIFLTAVIIEAAFAAFCIVTKSKHAKERSIIRIACFAGFLLLAVLPIIDWGFRYYALATLLLLLSIIGVKTLIQKKEEKREYKALRVVLKAIGMTALIFAAVLPAVIFPQNKAVVEASGEYRVSTKTYTVIDESRVEGYADTDKNRKLNVQFWYPDSFDKTFPVIVFSHGGLGVKTSNESLYKELAGHGYVVCSIDHTYQCFYTTDEDGKTTLIDLGYMQELFAEDAQSDIRQSFEYYRKWMEIRIGDMNFIIDHIIAESKNNNAGMAYKLADITKIGVMGHSLGGSAALGIGRIRDDVGAVIALESPFMYDIESIEDDRFIFMDTVYPVPVLNVYSDSSWEILAKRPQYAANHAMLTDTEATAFNVHISGVGHLGLTDFSLTSPFLTRTLDRMKSTKEKAIHCLETINMVCLEFFDCYLKGEGEFISSGSY